MKWLKSWLVKQPNGEFTFSEEISFDINLVKTTKYLLDLKDVVVEGHGFYEKETESLVLDLSIQGIMIVPCALSLDPVDYPFQSNTGLKFTFDTSVKDDEIVVVKSQEIDIIPLVWELISLEIPLKVVKKGATVPTKGDGWELKNESVSPTDADEGDPRLAKLKDYFNKQ